MLNVLNRYTGYNMITGTCGGGDFFLGTGAYKARPTTLHNSAAARSFRRPQRQLARR